MDRLSTIDRLEALQVLADPHRMEILRLLLAKPHTITALGQFLGHTPAWVRHHIKALEAVGLVHLAEERTTRNYTEKFYAASAAAFTVTLLLRPDERIASSLVALVSSDLALELLAADLGDRTRLAAAVTGSLDALIGLRQGLADIAGCHLLDAETGEYNIPYARHLFPDRDMTVVTLAHREQGLIVPAGNPRRLADLADAIAKGARLVNRNRGSGTRLWIDQRLRAAGIEPTQVRGYDDVVDTHTAAAERVASGGADVAVGIAGAAAQFGLDFVPIFRERYDLIMTDETYATEEVAHLLDRLNALDFRREVARISGYDPTSTGAEYHLGI